MYSDVDLRSRIILGFRLLIRIPVNILLKKQNGKQYFYVILDVDVFRCRCKLQSSFTTLVKVYLGVDVSSFLS
jgi:hypothetical protein